jgi:drug/metabolite transporter (DMT)-like permease
MGEMTLNAFRFVGAFVLIGAVMFKRIRHVSRETIKASIVVSILIFIVYSLNTYGIQYTSVSNAGFLIALSVLFTPIVSIFINKKIPDKKFFIIAAACTVGIGLMTLDSHLKMAFGDILCLLCAFFCGIYLVMNERFVKREEVDAFQVGVFELGFAGVWFSILAFIMEEPVLPKTPKVWGCLLFLMLFSTGFAFIAQSIAQQYTEASRVGVIYTLEPVFSRIGARLILHEMLLPRAVVGEIILVISMIAMEVDLKKLFGRKS